MVNIFTSFIDGLFSMFFPSGSVLSITQFLIYSAILLFVFGLTGKLIRGAF